MQLGDMKNSPGVFRVKINVCKAALILLRFGIWDLIPTEERQAAFTAVEDALEILHQTANTVLSQIIPGYYIMLESKLCLALYLILPPSMSSLPKWFL